jgi:hypothetical protein
MVGCLNAQAQQKTPPTVPVPLPPTAQLLIMLHVASAHHIFKMHTFVCANHLHCGKGDTNRSDDICPLQC